MQQDAASDPKDVCLAWVALDVRRGVEADRDDRGESVADAHGQVVQQGAVGKVGIDRVGQMSFFHPAAEVDPRVDDREAAAQVAVRVFIALLEAIDQAGGCAAVRVGSDRGHTILGVKNGFDGLIEGDVEEMAWMSVAGWASRGGAELGTARTVPDGKHLYAIARQIDKHEIQGILMIGGWAGYEACYRLLVERDNFPSFNIPIICLPASRAWSPK